jgi:hypothetical protein
LEDKRSNAVGAISGRGALLASSGAGDTLASGVDEVFGSTDALVVNSLGE